MLPANVNATTSAAEAIAGAQFAIHAVPVQHTRVFLQGIKVRLHAAASLLVAFCACWYAAASLLGAYLTFCTPRLGIGARSRNVHGSIPAIPHAAHVSWQTYSGCDEHATQQATDRLSLCCCAILQDLLPPTLPIISVSKGIEVGSGQLMSEVIPSVLSKKHPTVYLSGKAWLEQARFLAQIVRASETCQEWLALWSTISSGSGCC